VALNDDDQRIEGPIGVLTMCFDDAAAPLSTASGFLDIDALDPGQQGSFSVDLIADAPCTSYLAGASGHSS
jgi:hypothetical protein